MHHSDRASILGSRRSRKWPVNAVGRTRTASSRPARRFTDPNVAGLRRRTQAVNSCPAPRSGARLRTQSRAFGTCKQMLEPLLSITDRMAQALPQLADLDLARATVTVLMTLLLRAYQAGARAAHRAVEPRGGLDEQALARAAAEQRDSARADDRSVRLLLTRIHGAYELHSPTTRHSRPPTRHSSFLPTSSPISSSPPGPQRARHPRSLADFRGRMLGITTGNLAPTPSASPYLGHRNGLGWAVKNALWSAVSVNP